MVISIKRGDKFPVTFTVNHDLASATTRLIVRHLTRDGVFAQLAHTVTDAATGQVRYNLDGTWAIGKHYIELEITQAGEIRTAPSVDQFVIRIVEDLDTH
ncbi:hypothetical protein [Microbacterium sp. Leaf320]|uniref:hypothetical protein n=1 Tax=Microbacterium sp. Leaf320 TaxID=1736334 RepID=UPI0006F2A7F2|nr:hypothetical protein [Microbacterium sp. Leaf320]KQQ65096.1 hypothetical protein ASF63_14100 [Microbacterium sp. Leaf320]